MGLGVTFVAALASFLVSAVTLTGVGVITEGVECPRIRMADGREFSLVGGDAQRLRSAVGEHFELSGVIVPFSICMQGQTLRIETMRPLPTEQ